MDEMVHVDQKAALGSTTTQIGVQNNYVGMSSSDACALATNLFLENFPKLQEEAMKIARQRVDEFVDTLLHKLDERKITDYSVFADPDVQYVLCEAQKKYARMGKKEQLSILTDLLLERLVCGDDMSRKNIIDQAIKTAGLLSRDQLDTLAVLMLVKHVKLHFNNIEQLQYALQEWHSIFPNVNPNHFSYLNSQGCLELHVIGICRCLATMYKFNEEDVKRVCPSNIANLHSDYGLSLIGKVIAMIHIQNKSTYIFDLDKWIQC